MANQIVSVEFVTEEANTTDLIAELEKSGGQLEDQKPWAIPADLIDDYADAQFEPFILVSAAVALGFLVKRISDVWLDHTRPGGQVIDTRGETIVVHVAPYLKRGTLVLQSDDGVEVFQMEDRDEAIPVLEKAVSAHG